LKTDLALATASELVRLFRKRKASPVEAVDAVLARAERENPRLNALCHIDAENALRQAAAAEKRHAKGRPAGPLDGVPVTVKELVQVAGWPVRMGSKLVDATQPAAEDAPAVARLRESGAVLLAQTTSPEFGHKAITDSPLHGVTRNPWNPAMTPGGSSGGAGAALAAGIGPLALGTDGGGSIRIPAAFCGVVGLKATYGRVAAWPASLNGDLANTGPMARSVEDVALMLNVIARPDVRDPGSLPASDTDYLHKLDGKGGMRKLRVALVMRFSEHGLDAEVEAAVRAAAAGLAELGCTVEEAAPDFGGIDGGRTFGTHWLCFAQQLLRRFPVERHDAFDPSLLAMARSGSRISSGDLVAAMADRRSVALAWNRFFERYDLVLSPAVAVPPFPVLQPAPTGDDGVPNVSWTPYTAQFNLSRHPALSVPCGLTRGGLPIGLQLAAAHYREAMLLRAAHRFQRAFPLPSTPPPA
jgi:aspartyl-tRNA(Asn)/glutamyl-tRNA(Gln) amidotransferase subunit A